MTPRPVLTGQRRGRILEAAAEVIAERGLCETRLADVARRAGTSAALVIYYFDTKDRLLTEALTFADDRFYLQAFHEMTDLDRPRDQLIRLIEMSCPSEHEVTADWTLWLELWTRARRDAETARKREALDRRWRTTIADIVREGQRVGEFAAIDAEEFALRLSALIDGLVVQVLLGDPEVTTARMRQVCLDVSSKELGFDAPDVEPRAAGRGRVAGSVPAEAVAARLRGPASPPQATRKR
jgi:AcrR family transcriptional regulator